jgi:hypothetical protein
MNELEISKRNLLLAKARVDLDEHERCLKATEEEAENAALTIIGQYPGQVPNDPEIYMRSIRRMLTGVPLEIVVKIADPLQGVARSSEFLPTIAVLTKWLDRELYLHERKAQAARDVIFTLERGDVSRETADERAAHAEAVLAEIRGKKLNQRIANLEESLRPSSVNYGQRDVGWEKRLEALTNLEATRGEADPFKRVGN